MADATLLGYMLQWRLGRDSEERDLGSLVIATDDIVCLSPLIIFK